MDATSIEYCLNAERRELNVSRHIIQQPGNSWCTAVVNFSIVHPVLMRSERAARPAARRITKDKTAEHSLTYIDAHHRTYPNTGAELRWLCSVKGQQQLTAALCLQCECNSFDVCCILAASDRINGMGWFCWANQWESGGAWREPAHRVSAKSVFVNGW